MLYTDIFLVILDSLHIAAVIVARFMKVPSQRFIFSLQLVNLFQQTIRVGLVFLMWASSLLPNSPTLSQKYEYSCLNLAKLGGGRFNSDGGGRRVVPSKQMHLLFRIVFILSFNNVIKAGREVWIQCWIPLIVRLWPSGSF